MSQPQVRTVTAGATSFLVREQPSTTGADDGTPLLLLHGFPETASCWAGLAPRLASGRRVLYPDLPGLGGSTFTGPYDVATLAEQVLALLDAELPGQRVDVVGHDWGGVLALAMAAQPGRVRRLVVANAPYRSLPPTAVHVPLLALPVLPEVAFRLAGRRLVDLSFALGWKAPTAVDGEALAEYRAAYSRPAVYTAALGYYRAAARPRIAALLTRGQVVPPRDRLDVEAALVLWGAKDPVLPVSTGEGVVRDLGADCVMVTVPGAGHFVVEEAQDVVADVLLDFLADERTPAPPVPAAPPAPPAEQGEVVEAPAGAPAAPPAKKAPAKRAPAKKAPATKAPAKKAPPKKAPPSAG